MAAIRRRPHYRSAALFVWSLLLLSCARGMHGAADQWTSLGLRGLSVTSLAIYPADPQILYAGTRSNGVFKTTDGGSTWAQFNNGLAALDVLQLAIEPLNPQTLYAGTYGGAFVYKTTNGGQSWAGIGGRLSAAGAMYITTLAVDPIHPGTLYAGFTGVSHGVAKTTDGGETWSSIYGGRSYFYLPYQIAVDPKNPQTLYLAVMDGPLKSVNGGVNWSSAYRGIPAGARTERIAVDPVNPKIVYAALGTIYKSLDAGQNWAKAGTGLPPSVTGITVDPQNPQTVYASVSDGALYRTVNGGQNWVPFNSGLADQTGLSIVVDPQNSRTVYAASQVNGIYSMTASAPFLADFYFPQVADGAGYLSNFVLVNPDNTTANATLELFKPEGTPLRLNLNGTTDATFTLNLPAHGAVNLRSSNSGDMQVGWARVRSTRNIGGAMIYAYAPAGITTEEAGMDPAVPLNSFSLPVDNRNGFSSGLAVANPNAQAVTLKLTLYNGSGSQVGQKDVALPAMNQTAQRIEAVFPEATAGFTGTLTVVSSGGAVAGTTLKYNASLSALSSTPVAPSGIWPSYPHFAQIADGGGYKSTIILLNLSASRRGAELEIYGQDGAPWPLDLNGTVKSRHTVDLPANGLLMLESPNGGSSATPGWARLVSSNGPIGGSIIYSYQGKAISAAGTGRSALTDKMCLPVDTRSGLYTGIAIANPNAQAITVDLQLYDRQGALVGRKSRTLEGLKQLAELEFQMFPEVRMTDFVGSILVSSTGGQIIGTVLRFNLGSSVFASIPIGLLP